MSNNEIMIEEYVLHFKNGMLLNHSKWHHVLPALQSLDVPSWGIPWWLPPFIGKWKVSRQKIMGGGDQERYSEWDIKWKKKSYRNLKNKLHHKTSRKIDKPSKPILLWFLPLIPGLFLLCWIWVPFSGVSLKSISYRLVTPTILCLHCPSRQYTFVDLRVCS